MEEINLNQGEAIINQKSEEVLIQVKELPSEFKGYPKGTRIAFSPLKLKELETLNTDQNLDATYAIAMLLDAIHCNTMSPEELYFYDVMYIGIIRKLQAFGDTKGVLVKVCPKCGQLVQKKFDYTEIEFKQIAAPALPIKIEIAGRQVEFAQLSMKQFLEIEPEEGETGVYARYIKNMPLEEAREFVANLSGIDIKKLKYVDKQLDYGMKPFVEKCKNTVKNPQTGKDEICGHEVVLEVSSPFEVVFPEDALEADFESEIQYG